ncbi:MAG: hypothetical protein LCH41_12205 [Armatimonadetes bacterium]|nr:hypothetical protein [Armatimonadota bacterium]
MRHTLLFLMMFIAATSCIMGGCNEHEKVPVSKEIMEKRQRLMPDGKIPDPRTARQKLKGDQ